MSKMKQVLEFLVKEGYTIDKQGIVRNNKGVILPGSKSDGYLKFSVRTDFTSSYAMRFHKFQAYVKYGDKIFERGQVVRHLNDVKDDNSYENIVLGSQTQNMMDRKESHRKSHIKNKGGIPEDIQEKILFDRRIGLSYRALVDKYGIPKSTIMDFVNRKIKQI